MRVLLPLDAVPLVTFGKGCFKMFDMRLPGTIISIVWVILMTALMLVVGPLIGSCDAPVAGSLRAARLRRLRIGPS